MEILTQLKEALAELLDIDPNKIDEKSYLVRDLGVESIDLLELALTINRDFKIKVNEKTIFFHSLRLQLQKIDNIDGQTVQSLYPYLRPGRADEILIDLPKGPVLQIADIIDYIQFELKDVSH